MLDNLKNLTAKVDNIADVVSDSAQKVKDALGKLPGAAINKADGNKTTERLVDQRTKEQNDNPRVDEGPDVTGV